MSTEQFDIFAKYEYRQNRKKAPQQAYSLFDLDIGTFFYNFEHKFYGIKLSRFMYFNLDTNQLCKSNKYFARHKVLYIAYHEVYWRCD